MRGLEGVLRGFVRKLSGFVSRFALPLLYRRLPGIFLVFPTCFPHTADLGENREQSSTAITTSDEAAGFRLRLVQAAGMFQRLNDIKAELRGVGTLAQALARGGESLTIVTLHQGKLGFLGKAECWP